MTYTYATDLRISKNQPVIMLDPGHGDGAKNSGASARLGNKMFIERDLNLEFAKKVGKKLEEQGYKVVYTRLGNKIDIENDIKNQGYKVTCLKGDDDITQRAKVRDQIKPDLFISIHCNSNEKKSINGIEGYYFRNALSDIAYWKTQLPNGTNKKTLDNYDRLIEEKNIINAKPEYKTLKFKHQLLAKENMLLAQTVQNELQKSTGAFPSCLEKNSEVKENSFGVIKDSNFMDDTFVPSTLIETGYISNLTDLKNFDDPKYREKIVQGIVNGIDTAEKLIYYNKTKQ